MGDLSKILREWFDEWKSLHGVNPKDSPFFELQHYGDDEHWNNVYAEGYVLGVKEAARLSDSMKDIYSISVTSLPDFRESAIFYGDLIQAWLS